MILIAVIIALVILILASITDLKSREVPDYLSYSLIFVAFAISIIYTIIEWNYIYLAQSTMGFIIGLIVAYSMFYMGQWGGGDSKLIMGLGAILGFNIFPLFKIFIFGENNFWLLILIANIIFFGAAYGLAWSIYLAIKNRKLFTKNLLIWIQKREIIITRRVMSISVLILIILVLTVMPQEFRLLLLAFIVLFYIIFYVWLFVKVIEESCMVKDVPINKLTEGDWIYKDVFIGKKYITGPKDLGVSREQIVLLKKYSAKGKIKTVTIKEGIPFIPAFLIAFIATMIMYYGGWF
jgi:Flp pilus assembly protein protease CpaA